jgi:hypothetical protein
MGHALEEVWRIVAADGKLIDVRPLAAHWPIEVVHEGRALPVGTVDGTLRAPDDHASHQAMTTAVRKGRFRKAREAFFEFAYYWDSLEELKAYVDDCWSDTVTLPESVMVEVRRLLLATSIQHKLCIRRQIMIAKYRRL